MSSQLIRVSCSYKRVPNGSSVLPNVVYGSLARCGAFPKVSEEALNLTGGSTRRVFHAAQLFELQFSHLDHGEF